MPNHVIVSTLGWGSKPIDVAFAGISAIEMGQVELGVFQAYGDVRPKALADGGDDAVHEWTDRIRGLISTYNLKAVSTVYAGFGDGPLLLGEEVRRASAVADLAKGLGVPLVTVLGSPNGEAFRVVTQRLQALREVFVARGIDLCMKTHRGLFGEIPADAVRVCEAVPGLGLTLEASHYLVGANQGEPFWEVLPFVRHVTLRDARLMPPALQYIPGYGDIDFSEILSRLHARGYEGKFAIEYVDLRPIEGPRGVPRDVVSAITAMRALFLSLERERSLS